MEGTTETRAMTRELEESGRAKTGKLIGTAAGAIAFLLASTFTGKLVKNYFATRQPSTAELTKVVEEVNKMTPLMLDADTRMVKATIDGHTIEYHYVLVNYAREDLDTVQVKELVIPNVTQASCGNPSSRALLGRKVNMRYIYNDRNDQYMFSFVLDDAGCKAVGK